MPIGGNTFLIHFINQFSINNCFSALDEELAVSKELLIGVALETATLKRPLDILFELSWVVPHQGCCIMIQWIVRVRLDKQEDEPEYHGVDSEDRFPIVTQNIQTNIA